MRRHAEFTTTVRRGRRGSSGCVVVHVADGAGESSAVGFVVPRSVGSAVGRNAVKRKLRALVAARLSTLPAGSQVVVRALPPAAGETSEGLGRCLDAALRAARSSPRRGVRQ